VRRKSVFDRRAVTVEFFAFSHIGSMDGDGDPEAPFRAKRKPLRGEA
jgi:hypothetical protein